MREQETSKIWITNSRGVTVGQEFFIGQTHVVVLEVHEDHLVVKQKEKK